MNVIYVDNNATTMVAPEVLDAMLPYFSTFYGNPSSMHSFGGDVAGKIKEARESVARLIGATPEEVVFTSCGTESDSTAIRAAIVSNPQKKHIVTSRVEHPAVKNLYETLSKNGYRVTFVPVDNKGRLDTDYLFNSLSEDTAIVSLMWANNETGVIFPIEEISPKSPQRCKTGASYFTPMRSRPSVRFRSRSTRPAWICCRFLAISCMPQRESVRFTSARAPSFHLLWWVATRRGVEGGVLKIPPLSSGWAKPQNWRNVI
jgi:hypothetical protein